MNLERDQEIEIPQMNAENRAAASRGVIEANITRSEWALLLAREQAARAEAEAATKRLQALQNITDTALTHLTLDDLLREMLAHVREVMDVDNCAILLVAADGQYLTVYTALGPEEQVAPSVRVPIGRGFAGYIAAHHEPLIVDDPSKIDIVTPLLREKLRSLLGVPLMIEDRLIGVIHVGTMSVRQFNAEDVWLLQRVADRVALAVDHAHLYEAERQAHSEAVARASQLEATFESMADGVIIYDSEGHIQQMNAAAREILTIEDEPHYASLLPQERVSLLQEYQLMVLDEHGEPLPKEQWPVFRILKGETLKGTSAVDIRSHVLNGREIQLSISGAPVFDEKGKIVGAVAIMRDVTERSQLEQRAHEALNAFLAIVEDLVVGADKSVMGAKDLNALHSVPLRPLLSENKIVAESTLARRLSELTCNVLGCRRVGITTIESETGVLRARAVVGLSPEQERQWWAEQERQDYRLSDSPAPELVARLRANEVLQFDMTQPPWSDQPNPYGITIMLIVPMCVGDQLVGMLTLDHGGIKHAYTQEEVALAGAVGKLAALVVERERLLREREEARANEIALREANRRMDEFLGIACHELKTPLAAIKGNVQLADRRLKRVMPQPGMHIDQMLSTLLESANRQADRLDRLVSDLLDVSRIQVGKLEMRTEPCDLTTIVQEAVQEQRMIVPKRSIILDVPPDVSIPIVADADRIAQVITNYLTNALKYSTESDPVEVFLTLEGKLARLSIRDKGPGVPAKERQHIWERFHRVQGIEVQAGSGVGLGLGLYISRKIIEWHHGHVGVESTPGQGSTFWFTLPIK